MKRRASGHDRLHPPVLWVALALLSTVLGGLVSGVGPIPWASAPHLAQGGVASFAPGPPGTHSGSPALGSALSPRSLAAPTCSDPNLGVDFYSGYVGANSLNFWPFYPYAGGYPCPLTSQDPNNPTPFNDELHATFSSPNATSAVRWSVPIRLPNNGSYSELAAIHDFYVGMVVTGNSSSVYNQSFLQVTFTPIVSGSGSAFYVTLKVIALFDNGYCTSAAGLSLTWVSLPACEIDLLNRGQGYSLTGPIPGGEYLRVTFNGANSNGITVYVNDSTQSKYSASYTLSPSLVTNQTTFTPYYRSSCVDLCYLNWSMPFGQGFGVDLGADASTQSFNNSIQTGTGPIWVGSPEYFNGSGYGGDFSDLALESASGGCSNTGTTNACPPIGSNWGYPYFQFNGTRLLFGSSSDYNWTTRDFGQVLGEFSTAGQPSDFDPMQIDEVRNSSQVGYIASGNPLMVSVRAQDLGSVSTVNLSYTLPDGTVGTASMSRTAGNASFGVYNASIPTTGGDGTIVYSILARSHAGTSERLPITPRTYFSVVRGPIPQFTITFSTNPSSCGTIDFNGLNYTTFQSVTLPAAPYTAKAHPCYPYVFSSWSAQGIALGPVLRTQQSLKVNLTANSTLTANWRYIRPFDTIHLAIDTNHCGSISLNKTVYNVNATVRLLDGYTYALSYSQCALNDFSGWVPSDPVNLSILGGAPSSSLTLHGNGTLELTYLPLSSNPLSLIFEVRPAACGGILFRGAGYVNGTAVAVASGVQYPIAADPCKGWGLDHWNASAGLTISGNYVTALSTGILTAYYYEETIVTIETYPSGCGYMTIDNVAYYNGSQVVVTNGSVFIIAGFPCAGYYFSGWYTTGGVFVSGDSMTVYGSGIIEAVFQRGTRTDFVAFITAPTTCGTISYNGVNHSGSQYIEVPPQSIAKLAANACVGYGFVSWSVGGAGITIVGNTAYVNGSGSITANFHPLAAVTLLTAPAACGTIAINGAAYPSGTVVELPAPDTFRIAAQPCAHYRLAFWTWTVGANIATSNGTLSLFSTSILQAHFQLQVYTVVVDIVPYNCGGLDLSNGGAHNDYTNNTTVSTAFGYYNVTAKPCAGFHLFRWSVAGGLTLVSNTSNTTELLVASSGNLTALYQAVSPILHIAVPSSAYAGTTVTLTGNVTTPVPPYTYTYEWLFGDGSNVTTRDGFTTHTYALRGTYIIHVKVIDPYHRTSNATATISVVGQSTSAIAGIGVAGYLAIAIAVVAVGVALYLGRRRPGESSPSEGGVSTPKPSSPPPDILPSEGSPGAVKP
ncbi:MAG: PKD domain-containing protein [Thermoplasmata archaeon]|nr:PKD domain-containing protein [Thermoplasmata archaeon]MCI4359199.1 PKD domain-containing protein [Thermoplasmata archaeon]